MEIFGEVLKEALLTKTLVDNDGNKIDIQSGIAEDSIVKIQELIIENGCKNTLEIGLAMGMSTLAILYALKECEGESHTAIDPYQNKDIDYFDPSKSSQTNNGWGGVGVNMVTRAGFNKIFQLIEEPSYLALPELVRDGKKFDLIFIDGYHTFDYTFIDYFYSDLLLREGGLLIFDDVILPMVHKVCSFLETHKSYELIGPRMSHPLNPFYRLNNRIENMLGKRGPRNAHKEWGSIIAYKKIKNTIVRPLFFHTNFYPYFNIWWKLKKIRGVYSKLFSGKSFPRKTPPFEDNS